MDAQEKQPQFDFPRLWKIRLLENVVLPEPEKGSRTSRSKMLAVLKAIDGLCGNDPKWTAKMDTIVERAQSSESAAKRAINQLVAMGLVFITHNKQSGWRASTYGICWSNLEDFDRRSKLGGDPPAEEPADCPMSTDSEPSSQVFFASKAKGHGEPSEGSPGPYRRVTVTLPKGHGDPSSFIPPSRLPFSSPRLVSPGGDGAETLNLGESEEARRIADRIARALRLGRTPHQADVDLAIKVGRLRVAGAISERLLEEALEAVRINRPDIPSAYFHQCLDNGLRPEGETLNILLAKLGK